VVVAVVVVVVIQVLPVDLAAAVVPDPARALRVRPAKATLAATVQAQMWLGEAAALGALGALAQLVLHLAMEDRG
jgi:hypothetical protein